MNADPAQKTRCETCFRPKRYRRVGNTLVERPCPHCEPTGEPPPAKAA